MSVCPLWVPIPTPGTHTHSGYPYPLWVPIPTGYPIPPLWVPNTQKIKFLSNNINTLLTKKFIIIIIFIFITIELDPVQV